MLGTKSTPQLLFVFNLLTFCCGLGLGTKKFICWAGIVGIAGAKIIVLFFGAAPDGLKTSTYEFFKAIAIKKISSPLIKFCYQKKKAKKKQIALLLLFRCILNIFD